jgi:hypothetical protein
MYDIFHEWAVIWWLATEGISRLPPDPRWSADAFAGGYSPIQGTISGISTTEEDWLNSSACQLNQQTLKQS